MKPGEYIGADGRTYRWVKTGIYLHGNYPEAWVIESEEKVWPLGIVPEDWPAAKAALDALIEAEAGEWVEIDESDGYAKRRFLSNGSRGEYWTKYRWVPLERNHELQAYRKGREVALEQVRELVGAIEAQPPIEPPYWPSFSGRFCKWFIHVRELAEKLEL